MKVQLSTVINNCDAASLKQIKHEINEILVSLRINVQLVKALTKDENELIPLNIYSYDIVQTGLKYMEFATNAISLIGFYEDFVTKTQSAQTSANCKHWGDKANETFEKIQEYSIQTIKFSVPDYQKHEDLYIKYLNASYRKGEMVGSKQETAVIRQLYTKNLSSFCNPELFYCFHCDPESFHCHPERSE